MLKLFGSALESFELPRFNRGDFRGDPWQAILTIISVGVTVIVAAFRHDFGSPASFAVILGSLGTALWRSRLPIQGLLAQLGLLVVALTFVEEFASACLVLTILCLISLAIEREIRIVFLATLLVQIAFFAVLVRLDDDSVRRIDIASIFGVVFGTGGAAGLGVALRAQRQYIDAIKERAFHAEATREAESRRRVSDERMRIARDLHDAVAHHVAVVSIYTGLARTTLSTSVAQTEEALTKVQESTRSVLTELQQIVHILRNTEDADGSNRQPTPEIGQIDDLVASFVATGFKVTYRVHGQSGSVPASIGLVAYRVIQEALSNSARHGDGSAWVDITFGDESILLEVVNRISADDPETHGSGQGLTGMRERVRLVEGTLAYTAKSGMFTVVAELPWQRQAGTVDDKRSDTIQDD